LQENTYPVSPREWEVRTVKKEILYRVRTLVPGDIFGHEEFIKLADPNQDQVVKREFRLMSLVHSEIIYVKKHEFLACKQYTSR
jgi:hypothetical protein